MPKKKKTLGKQERIDTLFQNISSLWKIIDPSDHLVMGVDPGRNSPGIAIINFCDRDNDVKKFSTNTKLKGFGKVIEVEAWLLYHIGIHHPGLIIMEDYSFDSEFGREKAGEMGGVIKRNIWLLGIPLITVAPQSLKAFIGVMKKEEIMKEVFRKWGIDTNKSDEADAVVLAKMGVGLFKIVSIGITYATSDERKAFEASPHNFVDLTQQEAKTLVNLIITRGDAANEFARGKEEARKATGKQKQKKTKPRKTTSTKTNKNSSRSSS